MVDEEVEKYKQLVDKVQIGHAISPDLVSRGLSGEIRAGIPNAGLLNTVKEIGARFWLHIIDASE